jgi:hypothetical protein
VLIIGDSKVPKSRHEFAKNANGIDVLEPIYLRRMVNAANSFDI